MTWKQRIARDGTIEIVEWVDGWGERLIASHVRLSVLPVLLHAPDLHELYRVALTSTDAVVAAKAAAIRMEREDS